MPSSAPAPSPYGSLNVFNHRTNIDIHNRLVCFDIKELGKQLKKLGMLIIQDQVWGRVTENRERHANTWYYSDEFHLLLKEVVSSGLPLADGKGVRQRDAEARRGRLL